MQIKNEGSYWFRRLYKEATQMSPHIRFVRIRGGFFRIYYGYAYLHEVYKEMPAKGYDLDDLDPRFEDKKYYEEYEDTAEITQKIKNFVEGYYDSIDVIRTRVYLMRNNPEYAKSATDAYKTMYVK